MAVTIIFKLDTYLKSLTTHTPAISEFGYVHAILSIHGACEILDKCSKFSALTEFFTFCVVQQFQIYYARNYIIAAFELWGSAPQH